jgi:hypothetical protein
VKIIVSVGLFFFSWSSRRKRKRTKKRSPLGAFRALRSATKGAAFGNCKLLKKFDQNFAIDKA